MCVKFTLVENKIAGDTLKYKTIVWAYSLLEVYLQPKLCTGLKSFSTQMRQYTPELSVFLSMNRVSRMCKLILKRHIDRNVSKKLKLIYFHEVTQGS